MTQFELEKILTDIYWRYTVELGFGKITLWLPHSHGRFKAIVYEKFPAGILVVINKLPWWKNWFVWKKFYRGER